MRFKRISDRTPLRTKLITALLVLVIMALAAISVASVYMLRGYVTTQHDTSADEYVPGAVPARDSRAYTPGGVASEGAGVVLGLQLPGQQLSWTSFTLPNGQTVKPTGPLPALPDGTGWAGTGSPVTVTTQSQSGVDTWRVTALSIPNYPVSNAQNETVTVVLAIDLGNINALTTRLILFDVIVGCAIVLVLAAVGVAVVQTNLRPLNDIEMTAGQIAEGPPGPPGARRRPAHRDRVARPVAERDADADRAGVPRAGQGRAGRAPVRGADAPVHRRRRARAAHAADHDPRVRRALPAARRREPHAAGGTRIKFIIPNGCGLLGSGHRVLPSRLAADGLSPEDLDHLVGRVEAEATRMGLLVEDLLTLARLDQQRPLAKAPVDLLTLAADAVQDARIVSPGRPIDLVVAPGTAFLVEGTSPGCGRCIANLVNNSITHTPAGTPVRVKIARGTLEAPAREAGAADGADEADGWNDAAGAADAPRAAAREVPAIVLDVEDDGPGMTAEQAQRVFERFYRADAARNRASGGTGLGLAIVDGLVSAHGGTVSVRTAPGQGADFQVKLPLSPDALGIDDGDDDLPA